MQIQEFLAWMISLATHFEAWSLFIEFFALEIMFQEDINKICHIFMDFSWYTKIVVLDLAPMGAYLSQKFSLEIGLSPNKRTGRLYANLR